MRDFDRLIARFRQFGGMRLVWQYAKMGVLWIGVKEAIRCIVHGRSLKAVYPVVTKLVDEELITSYETLRYEDETLCYEDETLRYENETLRYENEMLRYENETATPTKREQAHYENDNKDNNDNRDNRDSVNPLNLAAETPVWFCWLQGMEKAPELVKVCLESLRNNIGEEVIVLDDMNYVEYVQLPEFIVRKYRKGIIPPALFSDMLRLELLIRYGGTWIDSTVWASPEVGIKDSKCRLAWKKIRESDLFIYRYFNREGRVEGMSNWFIHAKAGNTLLKDTRDMLFAYWRDYDCTVEYYIFHLFFSHAAKKYPEMIRQIPKGNSYHALWLAHHAEQGISDENWQKLITNVPFHKLNWRKKMPKALRGLRER